MPPQWLQLLAHGAATPQWSHAEEPNEEDLVSFASAVTNSCPSQHHPRQRQSRLFINAGK